MTTEAGCKGKLAKMWNKVKSFPIFQEKEEKMDDTLLVAATVLAAMAYQAAISPPGGVASMDATEAPAPEGSPDFKNFYLHPSESLVAYFYDELSGVFWISNTISFMAALSVIFLYVSGSSLKRSVFVWLMRGAMCITVTSMAVTYVCAVLATRADGFDTGGTSGVIFYALCAWVFLIISSIFVVVYNCVHHTKSTKTSEDPNSKTVATRTSS